MLGEGRSTLTTIESKIPSQNVLFYSQIRIFNKSVFHLSLSWGISTFNSLLIELFKFKVKFHR